MTVIRNSYNVRNVLDFSGEHHSKNRIKKSLRALQIQTMTRDETGNHYISNQIKVGMYCIQLITNPHDEILKISDFAMLAVLVYETNGKLPIHLERDGRFKHQKWLESNYNGLLTIKYLVDIVFHCQRLDHLKAFL